MSYYPYENPRASQYIPTDNIQALQVRRRSSSRRLSDVKILNGDNKDGLGSTEDLVECLKAFTFDGNEQDDDPEYVMKEEYFAPEGTWGWFIVISAFWTNFVVDGISLCYSVMSETITAGQTETIVNGSKMIFRNGTNETTMDDDDLKVIPGAMTVTQFQTVGSTLLAVTLITGPFASVLAEKIGFRLAAMIGSGIATVGIIFSWAASPYEPSFWAFELGFGFITGIGFGIMFTISVVIVGLYFLKNRALATGVTVAGTGVGTLAMAPVIHEIIKVGGWQGAMWFQAAVCAASVGLGAVYRPVPKHLVKRRKSEVEMTGTMPWEKQLVALLRSPSYLILSFSGSFAMMGYFAPFGFLVDSSAPLIGQGNAVSLLMYVGVCNAVGRVLFGFLANKIGHALLISNVALTIGGIITIVYPFANDHATLILCAIVFGTYAAVFASMRSIVIVNVIGEEKFNVGLGLSLIFMGFATLCSNSLGGYLKDTTSTYDMSFYVAGAFLTASAVLCYPLAYVIKRERKGEHRHSIGSGAPRPSIYDVNTHDHE